MAHLPGNDQSAAFDVLAAERVILEQMSGIANGRERIAQFVRQRRKEHILAQIRLAQRRLRAAPLGNVRVHAHPFANGAARIDEGNCADRKIAPFAVAAPHSMLEHEWFALAHGVEPRVYRRLSILRMHRARPSEALIVVELLSGQRRPAQLFTPHLAFGGIRPQHALHRIHGGAKALLALDERVLRSSLRGGVAKDENHAQELAAVEYRSAGILDGMFSTVAGDQDRVIGESDDGALPQHLGDRAFHGCARVLVQDLEHLIERQAPRSSFRPAGQLLGDAVHEADVAGDIRGNDRISDAAQDRRQILFGAAQPTGVALGDDCHERDQQDRQRTGRRHGELCAMLGLQCRRIADRQQAFFFALHLRHEVACRIHGTLSRGRERPGGIEISTLRDSHGFLGEGGTLLRERLEAVGA